MAPSAAWAGSIHSEPRMLGLRRTLLQPAGKTGQRTCGQRRALRVLLLTLRRDRRLSALCSSPHGLLFTRRRAATQGAGTPGRAPISQLFQEFQHRKPHRDPCMRACRCTMQGDETSEKNEKWVPSPRVAMPASRLICLVISLTPSRYILAPWPVLAAPRRTPLELGPERRVVRRQLVLLLRLLLRQRLHEGLPRRGVVEVRRSRGSAALRSDVKGASELRHAPRMVKPRASSWSVEALRDLLLVPLFVLRDRSG